MKKYYEILQVNEKANKDVIEKIYKVLVKKYHPDLEKEPKEKEKLEKKLKEINEAYEVLSDDFLRKQYDIELEKEKQQKYKEKYGEKNYSTEIGKNYKTNINSNQYEEYNRIIKNLKPKYKILNKLEELYKNKEKRDEAKESFKKDIIAFILTALIVIIVGIILKINNFSIFNF